MTIEQKLKELKTFVEESLSKRSDDFGHDTQALLEWEARQLQVVGELAEKLITSLELALYYVDGESPYEILCSKIENILELRDEKY